MKSFPSEVKVHGLRPFESSPKNSGFSLDCRGAREQKWGLEGYSPAIMTIPRIVYGAGYLDMSVDWPFPQVWQTDTGIYIGKRDGLYKAVGTTGTWTATRISGALDIDWPWTIANCPMFPVFSSGDCLVYYDYDNTAWATYNGTTGGGTHWDNTWKCPVATLYHQGQVFMVGANVATTAPSFSRIVRWSEIGAFRFLGKTAVPHSNEAGIKYAEIDDTEILMRALPLGEKIIVYGSLGCFSMRPVTKPVPSFAFGTLKNIGILNPLAVGGWRKKHIAVSKDGTIWKLTYDLYENTDVEKVGFSEYLGNMQRDISFPLGIGIVSVTYNEREDEFYISDGREGFLYNDNGLTRVSKNIGSFFDMKDATLTLNSTSTYLSDQVYGVYTLGDDSSFFYQSDTIDAKMNAIKVIETIELIGSIPEGAVCEVMIETRTDRSKPFRSTKWTRTNPNGVASPVVAGTEMRINVRVDRIDGLTLEGIRYWWKLIDKRGVRGNYVNTVTS